MWTRYGQYIRPYVVFALLVYTHSLLYKVWRYKLYIRPYVVYGSLYTYSLLYIVWR